MSWNYERSTRRIKEHLNTVPYFDSGITLAQDRAFRIEAREKGFMDRLSTRRAFTVEGAHLYGQLLDFNSLASNPQGEETDESHRRLLQFLDLYYQLWDQIVDANAAERVDYHVARMHAVVTDPQGNPLGQVQKAYALAAHLAESARRIGELLGISVRIRFGIDQGRCLAMTTGRAHDRDTLFLGSPANHAAKKAAEADEEGIFIVERLGQRLTNLSLIKSASGDLVLAQDAAFQAMRSFSFPNLSIATNKLIAGASQLKQFMFYRPTPPLADLKFVDLSASKTAKMGMTSIFADIDGFTNFVDLAIQGGEASIKKAATAVHVIREELNDVLKADFGGKRVRFIGDCIQGVLAAGERTDDHVEAVNQAALCAAGMGDSFRLCQRIVGGIDSLDLAIGIEHGPTPLTRLGLSGNDSVRCAASRAVVVSERVQQSIPHGGIKLGPVASRLATPQVRKHFENSARIISFDAAADLLGSPASPAVTIVREDRSARPYIRKFR
jgi:class 3 adenylate cyclase